MIALRWMNLILAVIGILIYLRRMQQHRAWRWFGVAPVTWLLHVALFTAVAIFCDFPNRAIVLNLWSSAVRLHGLILITGAGFLWITSSRSS